MTEPSFTRDGSRVILRPGTGAWTHEFVWSQPMVQHDRCEGSGWLWGHEVGDHETDHRYTCHECEGSGTVPGPDIYPMTTEVGAGERRVCYTITAVALPPEADVPRFGVVLEAVEVGHAEDIPHAVIMLFDVIMPSWRFEEPDYVRESAEESIRVSHHWVSLALRLAAPMTREQAEWLTFRHVCGIVGCGQVEVALRCPPLSMVTP